MGGELIAEGIVRLKDLEEQLAEARDRINLAIDWINNKSIIGEISRPLTKRERKSRKPKGSEGERPKRTRTKPPEGAPET